MSMVDQSGKTVCLLKTLWSPSPAGPRVLLLDVHRDIVLWNFEHIHQTVSGKGLMKF